MITIIGLTGQMRSGKDTAVDYFKTQAFEAVSLSAEVRKEAKRRGLPENRTTLQDVGDILRKEKGHDVLAKRAAYIIDSSKGKKFVVNGIRNPAEIEFLRSRFPQIIIIGITASVDVRFARAKKLHNELTREEFAKDEQRDRGVRQKESGNKVDVCLAMADVIIENNGGIEELHRKIEEIVKQVDR